MSRKKSIGVNEDGFTMVEILIATVLIVFGMLAYIQFSGSIIDQNEHSKKTTVAVNRAQEKLEDLKRQALTGVLNDTTGTDTVDTVYTRTWSVTNGGSGNLSTLTATVTWEEETPRSVSLKTLISQ